MTDFYSIDTVGAGGCCVCDDVWVDTKREAWDEARRRIAAYPEYCTLVDAAVRLPSGAISYTLLWSSVPHPNDNPSLPRSPRDDEYEG